MNDGTEIPDHDVAATEPELTVIERRPDQRLAGGVLIVCGSALLIAFLGHALGAAGDLARLALVGGILALLGGVYWLLQSTNQLSALTPTGVLWQDWLKRRVTVEWGRIVRLTEYAQIVGGREGLVAAIEILVVYSDDAGVLRRRLLARSVGSVPVAVRDATEQIIRNSDLVTRSPQEGDGLVALVTPDRVWSKASDQASGQGTAATAWRGE